MLSAPPLALVLAQKGRHFLIECQLLVFVFQPRLVVWIERHNLFDLRLIELTGKGSPHGLQSRVNRLTSGTIGAGTLGD